MRCGQTRRSLPQIGYVLQPGQDNQDRIRLHYTDASGVAQTRYYDDNGRCPGRSPHRLADRGQQTHHRHRRPADHHHRFHGGQHHQTNPSDPDGRRCPHHPGGSRARAHRPNRWPAGPTDCNCRPSAKQPACRLGTNRGAAAGRAANASADGAIAGFAGQLECACSAAPDGAGDGGASFFCPPGFSPSPPGGGWGRGHERYNASQQPTSQTRPCTHRHQRPDRWGADRRRRAVGQRFQPPPPPSPGRGGSQSGSHRRRNYFHRIGQPNSRTRHPHRRRRQWPHHQRPLEPAGTSRTGADCRANRCTGSTGYSHPHRLHPHRPHHSRPGPTRSHCQHDRQRRQLPVWKYRRGGWPQWRADGPGPGRGGGAICRGYTCRRWEQAAACPADSPARPAAAPTVPARPTPPFMHQTAHPPR